MDQVVKLPTSLGGRVGSRRATAMGLHHEGVRIDVMRPDELAAVRSLFREYAASLPFDLSYQGIEAEIEGLPSPYVTPYGALLVARAAECLIGTVGLRPLSRDVAEIKRLYVVPDARRRRAGRALLESCIAQARRLGYERVRLDSHRASMALAITLYRKLGFVEIAPYGPDLDQTISFFELCLHAR
jgi:putative acetyltransferase